MMNGITSFKDEYFFLSNYYEIPVTYNGVTYQSSEAAYQAQKCPERIPEFVNLTPDQSKHYARKLPLRKDWEQVKVRIMTEIVREKFTNPEMREKLLGTGNAYLAEGNTWGDRIWGTVDGQGQNLLGQILMQVRNEIRNELSITYKY